MQGANNPPLEVGAYTIFLGLLVGVVSWSCASSNAPGDTKSYRVTTTSGGHSSTHIVTPEDRQSNYESAKGFLWLGVGVGALGVVLVTVSLIRRR